MGKYNFDKKIDRKNTNCIKFDYAVERGMPEDVLSLWVADMDFETAPGIQNALIERAKHGIYGYTKPKSDYKETVAGWMKRRHNWNTELDWYVLVPGVVFALSTAVRALTKEGDGILIQRPVYYPFTSVIMENNRMLVNNPLVYEEGVYKMDLVHFEESIIENNVKLFILCNPHNPVGRVWTKEELTAMGDICLKHNVTVVADEIHSDFIRSGYTHTVFADIKPEFADITVTCTSPSKTFNLAGLQISNIIISNEVLRKAFKKEINRIGYDEPALFGVIAGQAAYETGEDWLEELKVYLEENLSFVREFLKNKMPKVTLIELQGTYLIWLDFRAYGLSDKEIEDIIVHKARLWFDTGSMFGPEGEGFQRINIATNREYLEKALLALEAAFSQV